MILSNDLVELQLAQIDLLMAMYPNGVSIDEASSTTLNILRESLNSETTRRGRSLPPNATVSLLLALEVDNPDMNTRDGINDKTTHTLQLDVVVPFTYQHHDDETPSDEPPRPRIRLLQPSWMSKAEAAALMAHIQVKDEDDDLFLTIENIRGAATSYLSSLELKNVADPAGTADGDQLITRVWFYFPSISTRSKRDDIVNYAPTYRLTGFLLSGKPGVLCLEGASDRVDAYMKFIKTESWGDIPSYQKKVSERFREVGVPRVFADMQEITDDLGERRGERANRGDMKALEAWLVQRGLGEALMKVLT